MTNLELYNDYHAALEAGNMKEAIRLANLVDFISFAPPITKAVVDTTAADYASKLTGFDFEKAILARDESKMHTFI